MKKSLFVALAYSFTALFLQAQTVLFKTPAAKKMSGWLDDFSKAQFQAAGVKQPIFALFTGSDWCPWCMKLHSEVLDSEEFKAFAKENLVLFVADFPKSKKLSFSTKEQNDALAKKYNVEGFPTVVILDAQGKELARTGYQRGGGEKYVSMLKSMLENAGVNLTTTSKSSAGKPCAMGACTDKKASK